MRRSRKTRGIGKVGDGCPCALGQCVASGQELTFRQTDVRDQRERLGVSILEGRIRGWRGWEG